MSSIIYKGNCIATFMNVIGYDRQMEQQYVLLHDPAHDDRSVTKNWPIRIFFFFDLRTVWKIGML